MATHIHFAEFPECDVVNSAFCRHRHCRSVSRIGNLFSFHCGAMKSAGKMAADVINIRKRLITRAFLHRVQNGEESREAAKRTATILHSSVGWFLCVAIRRHDFFSLFAHGNTSQKKATRCEKNNFLSRCWVLRRRKTDSVFYSNFHGSLLVKMLFSCMQHAYHYYNHYGVAKRTNSILK